jgi:hypothetical protein
MDGGTNTDRERDRFFVGCMDVLDLQKGATYYTTSCHIPRCSDSDSVFDRRPGCGKMRLPELLLGMGEACIVALTPLPAIFSHFLHATGCAIAIQTLPNDEYCWPTAGCGRPSERSWLVDRVLARP